MKRWLLMGAAVLALVLAVSLGLRSPAPVPGSGDKILTAAGEPITRDELEEARRSARALWDLGAAQSVPDDRELLARTPGQRSSQPSRTAAPIPMPPVRHWKRCRPIGRPWAGLRRNMPAGRGSRWRCP